MLLLAISGAIGCVSMTDIECVSTLPQCCSGGALCVRGAIFYAFALHALSDTNRRLMCVGAVAETFLSFDDHGSFSCLHSSLLAILVFPLWTISIYVSGHLSPFIHLLYLFCHPSFRLFSPWGDFCTVNFSRHIHPVTYCWARMYLSIMGVYGVYSKEMMCLIFKDLDVLCRSHYSVSSVRRRCCL